MLTVLGMEVQQRGEWFCVVLFWWQGAKNLIDVDEARRLRAEGWSWREVAERLSLHDHRKTPYLADSVRRAVKRDDRLIALAEKERAARRLALSGH